MGTRKAQKRRHERTNKAARRKNERAAKKKRLGKIRIHRRFTLKHRNKWPHCTNIKCMRGHVSKFKAAFAKDKRCNGFSFTAHKTKGGGCLKQKCTREGIRGWGHGSHGYYAKNAVQKIHIHRPKPRIYDGSRRHPRPRIATKAKLAHIRYGEQMTKNAMALKVFATMTADKITDYSTKVGILGELLKKMMVKSKKPAAAQYVGIVSGMQRRNLQGLEKYMLRHIRARMHSKKGGIIAYGAKGKNVQVDGRTLGLKHGFKVLRKISTPAGPFYKAVIKFEAAEHKKTKAKMHFSRADWESLKSWKGN